MNYSNLGIPLPVGHFSKSGTIPVIISSELDVFRRRIFRKIMEFSLVFWFVNSLNKGMPAHSALLPHQIIELFQSDRSVRISLRRYVGVHPADQNTEHRRQTGHHLLHFVLLFCQKVQVVLFHFRAIVFC